MGFSINLILRSSRGSTFAVSSSLGLTVCLQWALLSDRGSVQPDSILRCFGPSVSCHEDRKLLHKMSWSETECLKQWNASNAATIFSCCIFWFIFTVLLLPLNLFLSLFKYSGQLVSQKIPFPPPPDQNPVHWWTGLQKDFQLMEACSGLKSKNLVSSCVDSGLDKTTTTYSNSSHPKSSQST